MRRHFRAPDSRHREGDQFTLANQSPCFTCDHAVGGCYCMHNEETDSVGTSTAKAHGCACCKEQLLDARLLCTSRAGVA